MTATARMDTGLRNKHVVELPLEVKADGENGTFEGYGAIFGNVDRDGDTIAPGAFAESLKGRLPALLWQHNAKEPIGRFDIVREDKKGLFVKGRLSSEGRGREAYELLKMGALNGLSIGFVTRKAGRDPATGTRTIYKAELMEVSLVTFPANEMARVATVKQRSDFMHSDLSNEPVSTPRSFERFLRENGFSRSRAKAITAKGFRLNGESEPEQDLVQSMVSMLKTRQDALEAKSNSPVVRLKKGVSSSIYQLAPARQTAVVTLGGINATNEEGYIAPFDVRNFSAKVWIRVNDFNWQQQSRIVGQSFFNIANPNFNALSPQARASGWLRLQFLTTTQNLDFRVLIN